MLPAGFTLHFRPTVLFSESHSIHNSFYISHNLGPSAAPRIRRPDDTAMTTAGNSLAPDVISANPLYDSRSPACAFPCYCCPCRSSSSLFFTCFPWKIPVPPLSFDLHFIPSPARIAYQVFDAVDGLVFYVCSFNRAFSLFLVSPHSSYSECQPPGTASPVRRSHF